MSNTNQWKKISLGYFVAVIGLIVLGTGCASTGATFRGYPGPVLDTNQIAQLKVIRELSHWSAFVWKVDGVSLGEVNWKLRNNTRLIELLPGDHTLEVGYADANLGRSLANMPLRFTCQANHVYELRVAAEARDFDQAFRMGLVGGKFHWTAWITDCGTHEVVAGRKREEPARWYE